MGIRNLFWKGAKGKIGAAQELSPPDPELCFDSVTRLRTPLRGIAWRRRAPQGLAGPAGRRRTGPSPSNPGIFADHDGSGGRTAGEPLRRQTKASFRPAASPAKRARCSSARYPARVAALAMTNAQAEGRTAPRTGAGRAFARRDGRWRTRRAYSARARARGETPRNESVLLVAANA